MIDILVSDGMTRGVVTSGGDETLLEAARKMSKRNIGSVFVLDEGMPVGVLTKTDVVRRIAEGVSPSELVINEVMSTPVKTISHNCNIVDAMKEMRRFEVERLAVVDSTGKMVGVVSETDIIVVAPGIIDLLEEKANADLPGIYSENEVVSGVCSSCDEYSDKLMMIDGELLCEDCRTNKE
ncbi:MAG: CBS domain-containing protein [Candidatus Diapherotrites archaeon]|nr:CBS domain-containing protein [Candidatus Diapherotrites archaeon]